jgi:RNA polymerase sigma factor for flagellar operon FliA
VADLAQELDLTVDQCHHLLMQVNTISFYEMDEMLGQPMSNGQVTMSDQSNPQVQLEWKARLEMVWEAIETLSERHKLVLWLYYREELTMKEVGSVMGINEARVSQLHSKAIANLRREVSQRLYCQSANNAE